MARSFPSARTKLDRAEHHRKSIEPEVKAFVKGNPVTLRRKDNFKGASKTVRVSYFVKDLKSPPQHWALAAGDSIQNLRAALDHVVWRLVIKQKGTKFAEANARQIEFPIADQSTRFPEKRLVKIGLTRAQIAVIKQAQPYRRKKDAPRDHALWVLRSLSNIDKHRPLHLIVFIPEEATARTTPVFPGGKVEFIGGGPIKKGAEVVRFTAPRPTSELKMKVDLEFKAGVCLAATPETRPIPIDLALRGMRDHVREVIDALATKRK